MVSAATAVFSAASRSIVRPSELADACLALDAVTAPTYRTPFRLTRRRTRWRAPRFTVGSDEQVRASARAGVAYDPKLGPEPASLRSSSASRQDGIASSLATVSGESAPSPWSSSSAGSSQPRASST
jgi:hypothetical protein